MGDDVQETSDHQTKESGESGNHYQAFPVQSTNASTCDSAVPSHV